MKVGRFFGSGTENRGSEPNRTENRNLQYLRTENRTAGLKIGPGWVGSGSVLGSNSVLGLFAHP